MNFDTMGGRKFILALFVVICTVSLMWFAKINDGVFSTIMIAVVGAYIAGNVTQKATAPEAPKDHQP